MTDEKEYSNYDDEEIELEARELSPDKAHRKLLGLVQQSPTYEAFKAKLSSNLWWYLGQPMPEPYKSWTWANFEAFYNQYKK